ncbi:hypothetical protein GCM10009107_24810 [Ideonella azotifigens]|uniref:Uncharacterized protein n=1 Tax=Ideonella azotifigens TaxID=513160 RepID=A0ABP3VD69_9BURK
MPASRAISRRLSVETLRCGPSSFNAARMMSSREMCALRPGPWGSTGAGSAAASAGSAAGAGGVGGKVEARALFMGIRVTSDDTGLPRAVRKAALRQLTLN